MDAHDKQLIEQYRPYFGDMPLSDAQMLKIIETITAISGNIVDSIFKELLTNDNN